MGADKALTEFCGLPLIACALRILRDAGLPASIAGSRPDLRKFAPVVDDLDSGRGPLAGIYSAIAITSFTWSVFVPIDVPLLPSPLVKVLLDRAQITLSPVTLASVAGFAQTFPCVLNRAVLPSLRGELEVGGRGCYSAFWAAAKALGQPLSVIPAELLAQTGQIRHPDDLPPARWFSNINSPADLKRSEAFRPGSHRTAGPYRVS